MTWLKFECGCERDDVLLSPKHVASEAQSSGDKAGVGNHHYPIGREPANWCIACGSERPCKCDKQKKGRAAMVALNTKHMKKGKKR